MHVRQRRLRRDARDHASAEITVHPRRRSWRQKASIAVAFSQNVMLQHQRRLRTTQSHPQDESSSERCVSEHGGTAAALIRFIKFQGFPQRRARDTRWSQQLVNSKGSSRESIYEITCAPASPTMFTTSWVGRKSVIARLRGLSAKGFGRCISFQSRVGSHALSDRAAISATRTELSEPEMGSCTNIGVSRPQIAVKIVEAGHEPTAFRLLA